MRSPVPLDRYFAPLLMGKLEPGFPFSILIHSRTDTRG
jgi:hypothetical protein